MANILFAWERGAGFGHVIPHLEVIRELRARGHKVLFALKRPDLVKGALSEVGCPYVQAPHPGPRLPLEHRMWPLDSIVRMLFNVGFHDAVNTASRLRAWRKLFLSFKPDLLVADFSPTALLAARGMDIFRLTVNQGTMSPPDIEPLPRMRFWAPEVSTEILLRDEKRLVSVINVALEQEEIPLIAKPADLIYGQGHLLRTIPELDPYSPRSGSVRYRPLPTDIPGGVEPCWPGGDKARIFGYLKPQNSVPLLLKILQRLQHPTLIHGPELSDELKKHHANSNIRFSNQPLALKKVMEQCRLVVLNATHGTVLNTLLAGRPMLTLTDNIDQKMTGWQVEKAGVGLAWPPFADPPSSKNAEAGLEQRLKQLLSEPRWQQNVEKISGQLRKRLVPDTPEGLADEMEFAIRTNTWADGL